jgi:hypothetical protein
VNLLTEIQTSATDPSCSTSDLLRKCQILSFRLRHEPFKQWVVHELNGYPDDVALPRYRGPFEGTLKADTHGGFGAQVNNIGVPDANVPEDVRVEVKAMSFRQGVGELTSLISEARRADQSVVANQFPIDLAVLTPVVQGYQTVRLWKELPVTVVAGILDSIRSKALEFTLEIEAANPDAGDVSPGSAVPPVPSAQADVIFQTVVYGGQNAIGPSASVLVVPGDINSLMGYLASLGVEQADRDVLAIALRDEASLGPLVKAWLGEMAAKTAAFGSGVAQNAAGGLIAAAVLRFLGVA